MINEWQPIVATPTDFDIDLLRKFASISHNALAEQPTLAQLLNADEQNKAQGWLRISEEKWQPVFQQLDTDALFPLAVFFTLAEQQLNGWQSGSKNPAIWIFRWLKSHNQLPDKAAIRQLKTMTDNRYIPYGSVL